jgi:hypothetical protein
LVGQLQELGGCCQRFIVSTQQTKDLDPPREGDEGEVTHPREREKHVFQFLVARGRLL